MPNLTVRLRGSIIKGQGNYPLTRSPIPAAPSAAPSFGREVRNLLHWAAPLRSISPWWLCRLPKNTLFSVLYFSKFLANICPFFFQRPLSSLLSLPRRKRKNADTFPKIPPSRCEAVSAPKPNSEGTSSNPAPLRTLLTARRLQTPPQRLHAHPRRAAALQQLFKKIATRLQRQGRMLPAHD